MTLTIHVMAGAVAMLLGAVALSVKKGGRAHRRSGMLFVCAMLVMGGTASLLGFFKSATDANVFAGLMTAYFVITALTTVRPAFTWSRSVNAIGLLVAVTMGIGAAVSGLERIKTPGLSDGGVPLRTLGIMSLILAAVLLAAAAGDIKILRAGPLRGPERLKRHLWRMCFALFIAAGSFFSIRERVAAILPEPLTGGAVRALPIVLLFATMGYWLWRLRARPRRSSQPPGGTDGLVYIRSDI